jgi:hypothetical protein
MIGQGGGVPRRMADPAFRAAQQAGRDAPHVRAINELVDALRDDVRGWMPYPEAGPARCRRRPLVAVLDLLSEVRVVLLQGAHARDGWARLTRRHPGRARQVPTVVATYHPSRQALFHPDPAVRQARVEHREAAYRQVAAALRGAPPSTS